jgi:hypothetical protein
MRRHLTYANVVATLALVFAMSGGALAAKHYLVTSTKQIKPSVLKTLRGKTGPRGAAGANGATGATGATGPGGPAGPSGTIAGTPVAISSGAVILTDVATGLSVASTSGFPSFKFKNNNAAETLSIHGVVQVLGNKVESWESLVGPGEAATTPSNAAATNYVDVAVMRGGSTPGTSPIVHVTCGLESASAGTLNCVAAR